MKQGPEAATQSKGGEEEKGIKPGEAVGSLDPPPESPEEQQDTQDEPDTKDAQGHHLDAAQLVGFQLFAVDRDIC